MIKKETTKYYTVKQVNSYIKQIFDGDFILSNVSVKGEVSNCKYHSSGHIYFSLKDASGVIACVMFASSAAGLKFRLEDGKQVIVTGRISVYEAAGRYQLYASKIEEEGQGDLFKQFEELKQKLKDAGFFAEEYKKPIPRFSYRIGVVTSQTGAVIRDIYNVASRRNPYAQILLYPAQVQGEGAAETIAEGIRVLDQKGLDVIIIGRGGGSMEDLWAFNEEVVARAIFNSQTPVISAVGHETDFTIADFVSDMRAPTPSAAAELGVFDYRLFEKNLADYRYMLDQLVYNQTENLKVKLKNYRLQIETCSPEKQLLQKQQRLADLEELLDSCMKEKLEVKRVLSNEIKTALEQKMQSALQNGKMRLALVTERLEGQSPLKRLAGGYAFASVKGKTLRSVTQIKEDDTVMLALKDGLVKTTVQEITKTQDLGSINDRSI